MPKKVLWFSRHEMTDDQRAALGDVEIKQINKSINSAYELIDEIKDCDILAIVAPINLQQQFLKLAGDKPVIMAVNDRVLIPQQDGTEDKAEFHFVKWEQLLKIEVVKQDFSLNENSRFLRELALSNLEKKENFNIFLLNAIAKHEDTPLDILKKLAELKFSNIRESVASNENTSPEILDELSNDEDIDVRNAVAKNKNTPEETLEKLVKDKDKLVSRTAKKSLDYIKSNLTIENEEKSLDLVDLDMVSKSAKNSLDEIIKNNTISNEKEQHDFQNKLYLRDERSI